MFYRSSGMATTSICLLQKFSSNGIRKYWDGLPLQCTTHISDHLALALVDRNPFWHCFISVFNKIFQILAVILHFICTDRFINISCSFISHWCLLKSKYPAGFHYSKCPATNFANIWSHCPSPVNITNVYKHLVNL